MEDELISIIVPIYNAAHHILRCIKNLRKQTWKNFEIILVDDGSVDASPEICDFLAQENADIKVIHRENGGAFLARKTGVFGASGQYVGFVDADDYTEPQMYSVLHQAVRSHDADCAICDFYAQSGPFKVKVTYPAKPGYYDRSKIEQEILPSILYDKQDGRSSIGTTVWAKLFRTDMLRQAFSQVESPLRFGEDHFQTVLFFQYAQSCCILDRQFLYHYIVHPHSTMTSYKKGYLENILLLHDEYRKLIPYSTADNLGEQIDAHLCLELCSIILNDGKLRASWKAHKSFIREIYENKNLRWYVKPEYYRTYGLSKRLAGELFHTGKHNQLATWLWVQGAFRRRSSS